MKSFFIKIRPQREFGPSRLVSSRVEDMSSWQRYELTNACMPRGPGCDTMLHPSLKVHMYKSRGELSLSVQPTQPISKNDSNYPFTAEQNVQYFAGLLLNRDGDKEALAIPEFDFSEKLLSIAQLLSLFWQKFHSFKNSVSFSLKPLPQNSWYKSPYSLFS